MRWLRRLLLVLLVWLLLGFAIGTVLRQRLERPVHYIGGLGAQTTDIARASSPADPDRCQAADPARFPPALHT